MVPPHVPSIVKSNFDPEYVRENSQMTENMKSHTESKAQFEAMRQALEEGDKRRLQRQRSNAFNSVNMSMAS